jgi:starch synthase
MAKPLSILYVASEVYPFVKVGGIADIAYSLPLAIRDLGHDIRVMVPKYGNISERRNRIHEINRLKEFSITIGDKTDPATVKSSSVFNPRNKVQAYISTNVRYFDSKKGIYSDPKTDKEYKDNDDRFIYFNRTVIETCLRLGWYPDIIHCNNWQTGIIPAYIKVLFQNKFKKTKIVYTIHDFYQQGVFSHHSFDKTGLPKEIRKNFIHKTDFNFLKGGLMYSDRITTVSPTYAAEILKDKTQSNGLNSLLVEKSDIFTGIIDGVDPWHWNPKNDPFIKTKFNGDIEAFKFSNKKSLLQKFKLELKEDVPVIAMISQLNLKKGIPLLIESLGKILSENIQFVFLGDGDSDMKNSLRAIAKDFPENFGLKIGFDEALAHQMEAGADMLINTSVYEPCGLNVIYSLIYGTVPIVRATGGLKDIVFDYDPKNKTGNGFLYRNLNETELYNSIKKALELYKKKDIWQSIVQNDMKSDFTWKAKKFVDIYHSALREL